MKIADLLHDTSYPVFLRVYYLKHLLFELRKDEYCRRKLGIRLFSELQVSGIKHSDTLFILGSGSSINQIPQARWEIIRRHDSIGFNFWPIHSFVPTMYFVEAIQENDTYNTFAPLCTIARKRAKEYEGVVKIVTELRNAFPGGRFAGFSEIQGTWYLLRTLPVAARNDEEFAYGLAYLRRKGLFGPAGHIRTVFKQASTVSCLIALAIRMQYRKIVLCGVDLNHSQYFYQDPRLYPETASLEFIPRSGPHVTNSPMPWRIMIEDVILEMKRQLLDPAGIEIFVENCSSALWPKLTEAAENVFGTQSTTAGVK